MSIEYKKTGRVSPEYEEVIEKIDSEKPDAEMTRTPTMVRNRIKKLGEEIEHAHNVLLDLEEKMDVLKEELDTVVSLQSWTPEEKMPKTSQPEQENQPA